jgi:RNA polymerase sigma factor (sigma-70 family)
MATDPPVPVTRPQVNASADVDAELVVRLVAGEMDALGALYQRHGGAVRTFLRRVEPTLGTEEADDTCQETFLTFHRTLGRYEHRGKLRSWLFGIALHTARGERRKRWWRQVLRMRRGDEAAGVALRRDDPAARVDAHQQVVALLAGLPAAQREVLVLTALEGLSVKEAAEVLGIPENAASTRLYRARAALGESP